MCTYVFLFEKKIFLLYFLIFLSFIYALITDTLLQEILLSQLDYKASLNSRLLGSEYATSVINDNIFFGASAYNFSESIHSTFLHLLADQGIFGLYTYTYMYVFPWLIAFSRSIKKIKVIYLFLIFHILINSVNIYYSAAINITLYCMFSIVCLLNTQQKTTRSSVNIFSY